MATKPLSQQLLLYKQSKDILLSLDIFNVKSKVASSNVPEMPRMCLSYQATAQYGPHWSICLEDNVQIYVREITDKRSVITGATRVQLHRDR